jgi:hypothetical protein
MEAAGRGLEVDAYLSWAASEHLNVVRVLAMAKHLFELPPARGLAHLNALLTRAASHGMFVEVVALADTASYTIDPAVHIERVGRIVKDHGNALLEIANEPYHPTQDSRVRDPAYLSQLLQRVPPGVPVALGAADFPTIYATGTYVTAHFPRSSGAGGWGHVRDLNTARELLRVAGKPIVNDEPVGAGQRFEPGRRDDNPERFRAAALASRLLGLGATFHYEGGLQARKPEGRELECFRAWQDAWTLLPGVEPIVPSEQGVPDGPVVSIGENKPAATFIGVRGSSAWVLAAGTAGPVRIEWSPGWSAVDTREWPQSTWFAASRSRDTQRR